MRETTIRRLLVLVLCALGIVALWILADRSLSTLDAAHSDRSETNSRSGSRAASPIGDSSVPGVSNRHRAGPPPVASRQPTGHSGAGVGSRRQTQSQQYPGADARPPAVRGLHAIDTNHDSITVRWNAVRYATRIAFYHVTLNGIPVGDTAGRQLTINWFNDDMTSHFIRVRAVDVDGDRGRRGMPLVVTRPDKPSPERSPAPPPKASPTPSPTRSSTPSPSPSPTPTTPPTASGSSTPGSPTNSPPGLLPTLPVLLPSLPGDEHGDR